MYWVRNNTTPVLFHSISLITVHLSHCYPCISLRQETWLKNYSTNHSLSWQSNIPTSRTVTQWVFPHWHFMFILRKARCVSSDWTLSPSDNVWKSDVSSTLIIVCFQWETNIILKRSNGRKWKMYSTAQNQVTASCLEPIVSLFESRVSRDKILIWRDERLVFSLILLVDKVGKVPER